MVSYEGKTKDEYTKVSLPKEMVKEVTRIIEDDKRLGFASIQEFVKESVRCSILKYGGIDEERTK
ncbi:MAG: hypothetical protein R6U44_08855 [Archaeoglobaceae archaeon]